MKGLLKLIAISTLILLSGSAVVALSFPRAQAQHLDKQRASEITQQTANKSRGSNRTFPPEAPTQDIDERRIADIAREIARALGESNPKIDILRPVATEQVALLDLSEVRAPMDPRERLWEVRLSGHFTILRGPTSIKAIHSDGLVLLLRASDGSIFAFATAGNTIVERRE